MRQDIRPIKAELRNRFKALRAGLSPAEKDEMDLKILNRVMNLWQCRAACPARGRWNFIGFALWTSFLQARSAF